MIDATWTAWLAGAVGLALLLAFTWHAFADSGRHGEGEEEDRPDAGQTPDGHTH